MEGIFPVLVDLCMNYWEIRLARDLWRAQESRSCLAQRLCMGSVPRLALLWTEMGAACTILSMRATNGSLHQKFNIFHATKTH